MRIYLVLIFCLFILQAKASSNENMVQVLHEGTTSLAKRIELIRMAKKTIDLEYYIFARDRIGKLFFSELIKKSQQGVKVRILLDGHKLLSEIDEYDAMALSKYGIELRFFNRTDILSLVKGQFRNHRKTLTIDNKLSIIGGRNIAESYYNLNRKYNFLDRDILIKGPIVYEITKSFDVFWNSELTLRWKRPYFSEGSMRFRFDRYNSDTKDEKIRRLKLLKSRTVPSHEFVSPHSSSETLAYRILKAAKRYTLPPFVPCKSARIVTDLPNNKMGQRRSSSNVGQFMREVFRNAENNILIDNPYFLDFNPFKPIFDQKLRVEGVDMKLYTNGLNATENMSVYTTFYPQSKDFMRMGIHLNLHTGGFDKDYSIFIEEHAKKSEWGSHSKTFVVDDTYILGSYNMDPHAYKWNTEIVLACENATELIDDLYRDLKKKSKVYLDLDDPASHYNYHQNATIGKRLHYWLMKIPAKVIEDLL